MNVNGDEIKQPTVKSILAHEYSFKSKIIETNTGMSNLQSKFTTAWARKPSLVRRNREAEVDEKVFQWSLSPVGSHPAIPLFVDRSSNGSSIVWRGEKVRKEKWNLDDNKNPEKRRRNL